MDKFYLLARKFPDMIASWHMRPCDIWDLPWDMFVGMADNQLKILKSIK
jgi:hypothetical protein